MNILPPEGSPDVGLKVMQMLGEILAYKQSLGLPDKWNRHNELVINEHWRGATKKAKLVSLNLIHTHRQRTVNQLTDNNPTFSVSRLATDPELEVVYDKLLRTAEYWWTEEEIQHRMEEAVLNGETYGATPSKVLFNPDREFGLGEVEVEVIDPFYFGLWPVKTREVQKAEAVLHFTPLPLIRIQQRYPDLAEEIRPEMQALSDLGDQRKQLATGRAEPLGLFASIAGAIKHLVNPAGTGTGEAEEVLVVEAWVKDYSLDDQDQPKYPGFIRRVTVCNAGQIVLDDGPNPNINPDLDWTQASLTYLFDKFPFAFEPSLTDTLSPWGMSDIEQLAQIQEEIDKTITQIGIIKDACARVNLVNPQTSGVHDSQFGTLPGVVHPSNEQTAAGLRWLQGPPIPADLITVLQTYKDYFFLVAGSFELEAAQTPGREVVAYKAIAALLERASTMLRGKIRNYSRMVREWGRMYLSHVMNWYTEDRFISYEEDGDRVTEAIRGPDLLVPVKLSVVSGSTMPRSQVQEREEAVALFQMGAIPASELLKKLDWPNRKKVLKELQSGPVGGFLEQMAALGMPPQVLDVMGQVARMDPKEVDKALQNGSLPDIPTLMAGMGQEEAPADPILALETEERQATIDKIKTERDLIEERIRTEQVGQDVKRSGIQFDAEKLEIERARTVMDAESGQRMQDRENLRVATEEQRGQGPYREQGLDSNNE